MSGTEVDRALRQDVAEVLVRYATGIDRRDWALFRTCFTEDSEADYGDIGHWRGADEITEWMARSHEACGHTLHRITNVVVRAGASGGDDGRVTARCYVDALVMGADNRNGVRAIGFYDDDLIPTNSDTGGSGWRIAHRRFTLVHLHPLGDP